MLLSLLVEVFRDEGGVKNTSTSSSCSSPIVCSDSPRVTVGCADARVFTRRGRSLHGCLNFGASLDRTGKPTADTAVGLARDDFCGLGGATEATGHTKATNSIQKDHNVSHVLHTQ